MLSVRLIAGACGLAASLAGCDFKRTLELRLQEGAPVEVSAWHQTPRTTGLRQTKVLLRPEAPEYRVLSEWLARNRQGWRKLSFEKGPPDGVFVTSGDFRLHFSLGAVTISQNGATYRKDAGDEEYVFL